MGAVPSETSFCLVVDVFCFQDIVAWYLSRRFRQMWCELPTVALGLSVCVLTRSRTSTSGLLHSE